MFVFGRPATRQNMEEGKNEGFKDIALIALG